MESKCNRIDPPACAKFQFLRNTLGTSWILMVPGCFAFLRDLGVQCVLDWVTPHRMSFADL